jgi:hypothetical protein
MPSEFTVDIAAVEPAERGDGIYSFRVVLRGWEGRCFITAAEAGNLSQLTADWAVRAITNLAAIHGPAWLKRNLGSGLGLQLRCGDARDPSAHQPRGPSPASRRGGSRSLRSVTTVRG